MRRYLNWYDILISPLLSGQRKYIISQVEVGRSVIEIGCGTGQLAQELSENGITDYLGVDIAPEMISIARQKFKNKGFKFIATDFLDLVCTTRYDYAILPMIIHSIDKETAQRIIRKASTIVDKIIIADYVTPQPKNTKAILVRIIEWLAGKEHYGNFKKFNKTGGILFYAHPSEYDVVNVISHHVFSIIILKTRT